MCLLKALEWVFELGFHNVLFEVDCKLEADITDHSKHDKSSFDLIIRVY